MSKETRIDGIADPHNYERWWDFVDQPAVSVFPLETVTAGANANDDVAATLVGIIPAAAVITGGYLAVSANSGGIDANNTSAWVVTVAGSSAISKTNSANLVADTPVAMTVALPQVTAGSAVKLAITNGTNADLNSAVCHVSLVLADSQNYPANGIELTVPNAGTATISDGVKGILALAPGAADNDEIYIAATTETVKFAAGESFIGEAYMQFTEANTDDANVIFGFTNAVGENILVDNGAGPKATGDYVAIWKVDGGTKWYAGVQANGTATPTADTLTTETAGGSLYHKFKIKCNCYSSTRGYAEFWIDEKNVASYDFAYASATEMQLVAGVKNGSANAETLNVDYIGFAANRS